MIVSQMFTSCEQLYSSKNTWVIIMAGNQTLLPFFLYKILSDMLHFVWGLQHFFKSKIAMSWQNRRMTANMLCKHPQMMEDWKRWNNPSPSRTRNFRLKTTLWRRLGKSRRSEPACNRNCFAILITKLLLRYHNTFFLSSSLPIYYNIKAFLRLLEIIV